MSKYSSTCKVLGSIVLALGIIGTLILAVNYGKVLDYGYDFAYTRDWVLTFTYLIGGCLITSIQSIVLFALGEILEFVERINCNIENEKHNSNSKTYESNSTIPQTIVWTCPTCGGINHRDTGTCGCGTRKP